MNLVVLVGRMVVQPELKYTQGSNVAVCSFRLAVERKYKDSSGNKVTDFIDCVAWRQQAELISNYVNKGQLLAIQGNLQVRNWQTQDGQNRRTVEVIVDNIQFCEKKQQSDPYGASVPSVAPPDPFGATDGIPDWGNNAVSNNFNNVNQGVAKIDGDDFDPFSEE